MSFGSIMPGVSFAVRMVVSMAANEFLNTCVVVSLEYRAGGDSFSVGCFWL